MASKKFICPAPGCGKKNFSFDTVKLTGQCFSCGFSGGGHRMLQTLGATQEIYTPRIKAVTQELREPKGEGLEYLHSRGVTGDIIRSVGIKWDGEQLFIPIWSPVTGSKTWLRRKPGPYPNYSDAQPGVPHLLGSSTIKDRVRCVLVEGPFDLLSSGLWGRGFALLGSVLDPRIEKWLRSQQFGSIWLWSDPDVVGYTKWNAIERQLREWHPDVTRVQGWLLDEGDPATYDSTERGALFSAVKAQGSPWPVLQSYAYGGNPSCK